MIPEMLSPLASALSFISRADSASSFTDRVLTFEVMLAVLGIGPNENRTRFPCQGLRYT